MRTCMYKWNPELWVSPFCLFSFMIFTIIITFLIGSAYSVFAFFQTCCYSKNIENTRKCICSQLLYVFRFFSYIEKNSKPRFHTYTICSCHQGPFCIFLVCHVGGTCSNIDVPTISVFYKPPILGQGKVINTHNTPFSILFSDTPPSPPLFPAWPLGWPPCRSDPLPGEQAQGGAFSSLNVKFGQIIDLFCC